MTQPGYVAPPAPGWWVRTGHIGVTATSHNWGVTAAGVRKARGTSAGAYNWAGAATGKRPARFNTLGVGNSTLSGTSLSWSHTGSSGAAVITWVIFSNTAADGSVSGTYAGNAMTQRGSTVYIGTDGTNYWFIACLSYPTASSGAQTVAVSTSSFSSIKANSLTYTDVSSFGTPVTNTGSGTSLTVSSVPSAINHVVSNMFGSPAVSATWSSYNKTSRWDILTGAWAEPVLLGDALGAATVSFSVTNSVSTIWAGMAIDLS